MIEDLQQSELEIGRETSSRSFRSVNLPGGVTTLMLTADSLRFYVAISSNSVAEGFVGWTSETSVSGDIGRRLNISSTIEYKRKDVGNLITQDFYFANPGFVDVTLFVEEVRYVLRRREDRRTHREFDPPNYGEWQFRLNRFRKRIKTNPDTRSPLRR